MRVVSLINGSLLSESASFYAIVYAGAVQLPFSALFVDNGQESKQAVDDTVKALQAFAESQDVAFEFIQLQGDVIAQLQHFCQLYAVDTLFCATRQKSALRSFSEQIVKSGIETDIAVVKVKNISHVRSCSRLMLVSRDQINPHVFVLWLGLLHASGGQGRIYLSAKEGFARATTKSGLKYLAAPFMQLATLSGIAPEQIEVVNALQPIDADGLLRYEAENNIDLLVIRNDVYTRKELNHLGDHSGVNSITFYPWKG
ncbi:hypothetical protein THMIRHAS_22690 [Thiosulfatimonas sediminis]|uniref:UspA domain-containing protein n=1 Tax=Thiosulfatimonas sediminis TaxID=2675054 RepID=A0A6F8PXS1_9GAMM|nr:universal stress protein [Thiosulfatimonas sediminis]BBP46896.1 hypothetical protein THMIRHAS_22690 [Thiosulfatimonas sediminis]